MRSVFESAVELIFWKREMLTVSDREKGSKKAAHAPLSHYCSENCLKKPGRKWFFRVFFFLIIPRKTLNGVLRLLVFSYIFPVHAPMGNSWRLKKKIPTAIVVPRQMQFKWFVFYPFYFSCAFFLCVLQKNWRFFCWRANPILWGRWRVALLLRSC